MRFVSALFGLVIAHTLLFAQQADRFAGVAPRMQEFVDKGEASGIVTLIAGKDRILHIGAAGTTEMDGERKMRTDDIFWIASMSKPITAVCIAVLADDGKLSFDDPLAKHLPEFAEVMVSENGQRIKPSRPITLRDVLTHTSGLGDMTNRQVVLLLADCWLRQGENAKVIGLLAPLDQPNQGDLAIAYLLGMALLRDKQIDRGQLIVDRILRNGDSAEARLLLGMAKLEALEYPAAIADLTKAVELNPDLPDLHSYLGQAQMASGDMTAARAAFEKELAQNPNDFESNLRLAVLLKDDGDYDRARELLARALRVRPGDPGALYQEGAIDLAAGDMDRACAILEKVVKQSPQFLEAHVSLAQVYYRMKRKADGDRERGVVQELKALRFM